MTVNDISTMMWVTVAVILTTWKGVSVQFKLIDFTDDFQSGC